MNIEFICPSGKLIQKKIEIKNLKLKGGATVWLRYSFSLMSLFFVKKTNEKRLGCKPLY